MKVFLTILFIAWLLTFSLFGQKATDTLTTQNHREGNKEKINLRKKYRKYYEAQKMPDAPKEDYLWTGEPVNADDLGLETKEEDQYALSPEAFRALQLTHKGVPADKIKDSVLYLSAYEDELRANIQQTFEHTELENKVAKSYNSESWQRELEEDLPGLEDESNDAILSETIIREKGLSLYSFSEMKATEATILTPAFEDLTSLDFKDHTAIRLTQVGFQPNTATLKTKSKSELDRLAQLLKQYRNIQFEIAAHTNAWGEDQFAEALSQQRAEVVGNYLVKKGINTSRIITKGYGKSQPIASNDILAGRRLNQRVEIVLRKE